MTLGKEGVKEKHSAKATLPSVRKKHSAMDFLNLRNPNVVFALQDDFKTKSYQLQSFITFKDLQSLFREFFHPRLFKKFKF